MARIDEIIIDTESLTSLAEALRSAELLDALADDGPFTVFAPANTAFAELGTEQLIGIASNHERLAATLMSHVVVGKYLMPDLGDTDRLETVNGERLFLSVGDSGDLYVEEARIIESDIEADNGVIHVIDLVITPLPDEIVVLGADGVEEIEPPLDDADVELPADDEAADPEADETADEAEPDAEPESMDATAEKEADTEREPVAF